MNSTIEFSRPVVVKCGVAFRVALTEGRPRVSRIVVATKARSGMSEEAQGFALLTAFTSAAVRLLHGSGTVCAVRRRCAQALPLTILEPGRVILLSLEDQPLPG